MKMTALEKMRGVIKKTSLFCWIFISILALGIFLRVFHFSPWLGFSPDQARDAMLVSSAVENIAPMPLLGPQAGNTAFKLGPLYYEAQYASARMFGNTPEAMAYPDLFFSILALPLLYFFLRKYFSQKTSLLMMSIMSISYFAILTSRFASNPNSIPFFVLLFLYSLLEIMKNEKNWKSLFWHAMLGFSIGVGIQLHTILIFTMPAVAFLVLIVQLRKKAVYWKGFALLLAIFMIVNIGQISYELKTNGANSKALFYGVTDRGNSGGKFLNNVKVVAACQIESSIFFLSSLDDRRECGVILDVNNIKKNIYKQSVVENVKKVLLLLIGVIFLLGGYVLGWKAFKNEENEERKNFLGLLMLYNLISLIVLVPVAGEIEIRYFIVLTIIPFLFLGLWFDFLGKKRIGKVIIVGIILVLLMTNFFVDASAFSKYANKNVSNDDNSILGEIKPMAEFIKSDNGVTGGRALFYGGRKYEKRFFKPLSYLLRKEKINFQQKESNAIIESGEVLYYADANLGKKYLAGDGFDGMKIVEVKKFGNVAIYKLIK
jgi:4-amino-4-deoxy-L-arabinose transferase-like glycosyltransferase